MVHVTFAMILFRRVPSSSKSNFKEKQTQMKKVMTIALGLGLILGLTTATFAQTKSTTKSTKKSTKATKAGKTKSTMKM
jgi:L-cystine uptake protein TcyP (sodium:dicarboxylate symporter family)